MKKIGENIYEHNGRILSTVFADRSILRCERCFFEHTCCSKGFSCHEAIPRDRYFIELKEKQMIKENVKFKCVVPSRDVEEKIAGLLYEKGLVPGGMVASIGACFMMFHSEGLNANSDAVKFCQWPQPLVSWQQALDLIATVEKPAPVFDIKPFDRVLVRGNKHSVWNCDFSNLTNGSEFWVIGDYDDMKIHMLVKYEGNEALLGTTDTPSGWWEVKNGKPMWVTLK